MDPITVATAIFLDAARVGELNLFKQSAAALDHFLGVGIPAILENTKDEDGRLAIHYAAAGGRVDVLKYLIEEMGLYVDVKDDTGGTSLCDAAIEGRLAAVEYLLEMGANPEITDDSNCTPLHHVAREGNKDAIPLLLSKGMNVDVTNDIGSPLQYATLAGKHDTVKVLLDHGANPNLVFCETVTPLHTSITSQSWQLVEALLK
ncbi:hypothetical protein MKX03_021470, partial [Papaver bracteatum]